MGMCVCVSTVTTVFSVIALKLAATWVRMDDWEWLCQWKKWTGLKKGRQGEKGYSLREGLGERFGLGLFYATHRETQTGQEGT